MACPTRQSLKHESQPVKRTKASPAETLAQMCAGQAESLRSAGVALHSDVGPLLVAAGLQLQLLEMDAPEQSERIRIVAGILDQAMEQVRSLSLRLNSSPVYRGGLKSALDRLIESLPSAILASLDYRAEGSIPPHRAAVIYESLNTAILTGIEAGATRIGIRVRAASGVSVRVADNGRSVGRARALSVLQLLTEAGGMKFALATGKSTIVSIRVYAARRSLSR